MNASDGGKSYIKWIFVASLVFCFIESEYKLNPYYDELVTTIVPNTRTVF